MIDAEIAEMETPPSREVSPGDLFWDPNNRDYMEVLLVLEVSLPPQEPAVYYMRVDREVGAGIYRTRVPGCTTADHWLKHGWTLVGDGGLLARNRPGRSSSGP